MLRNRSISKKQQNKQIPSKRSFNVGKSKLSKSTKSTFHTKSRQLISTQSTRSKSSSTSTLYSQPILTHHNRSITTQLHINSHQQLLQSPMKLKSINTQQSKLMLKNQHMTFNSIMIPQQSQSPLSITSAPFTTSTYQMNELTTQQQTSLSTTSFCLPPHSSLFTSKSTPKLSNTFPITTSTRSITTFPSPTLSSLPFRSKIPYFHSLRTMSTDTKPHEEIGVAPPTEQEDTIFGKITRGELKVPLVYSDDKCVVINDINPQAKRHMLLMPKKPITQISKATDDDEALLGYLMNVARKVAAQEGLEEGYRLVINNGKEGCQSVYHLHIHILGGEQLTGKFA